MRFKEQRKIILMILLTLVTQLIIIIKTSFMASNFGVGVEMDAFNFINSLTAFIFSFTSAGVTTILIPNMLDKYRKDYVNIFITFLYLILGVLSFLVIICRKELLINISGRESEFIEIAENLILIMLISQFIFSIQSITNAFFQCKEKFNIPKIITFITTCLLIFMIIIKKGNLSIYEYSSLLLITNLINIIIQLSIALKNKFKYKIDCRFRDENFKIMLKNFFPIVMSTGIYQISIMINTALSTSLGEGNVSMMAYANTIISMTNTLLIVNIMTYYYPKIVKICKNKEYMELENIFISIVALTMVLIIGFVGVGRDGIIILYQRGEFLQEHTEIVYNLALISIFTLPSIAIRDIFYRCFYSLEDTKTPFLNSIIVSSIGIVLSVILSRIFNIRGIVLGTLIGTYISAYIIFKKFKKINKFEFSKEFGKKLLLILVSSSITLVIVIMMKLFLTEFNIFLRIFTLGISTVTVYGGLLYTTIFRKN